MNIALKTIAVLIIGTAIVLAGAFAIGVPLNFII